MWTYSKPLSCTQKNDKFDVTFHITIKKSPHRASVEIRRGEAYELLALVPQGGSGSCTGGEAGVRGDFLQSPVAPFVGWVDPRRRKESPWQETHLHLGAVFWAEIVAG